MAKSRKRVVVVGWVQLPLFVMAPYWLVPIDMPVKETVTVRAKEPASGQKIGASAGGDALPLLALLGGDVKSGA